MVDVDFTSYVVEGELNPSSDTSTYIVLYQKSAKIVGIVHTHEQWSTCWFMQEELAKMTLQTYHLDPKGIADHVM